MALPVWVNGRVPSGYWSTRTNRMKYMRWLGRQVGFRKRTDWYRVTREHFLRNSGGGLLATVYGDSPLAALRDMAPDYDWKPWLMTSTPQRYWRDKQNRRRYMTWLGEQLGFQSNEDWYGLSRHHFHHYNGNGLLANYYQNSPLRAIKEFKPRVKWREWEFAAVTQGFWRKRDNRLRFMAWLGKQLGIRRPEDWYQITRRHFHEYGGACMLRAYDDGTPLSALKEYMPKYDWKPWLFTRVPNGYWNNPVHCRDYLRWLGQQLGFERIHDWYSLSHDHVRISGGGSMLSMYYRNSLSALLREQFPRHKWDVRRLNATHDGQLTQRLLRDRAIIHRVAVQ